MRNPITASSEKKKKKSIIDKYFGLRTTQGTQLSIKSVLAGKYAI